MGTLQFVKLPFRAAWMGLPNALPQMPDTLPAKEPAVTGEAYLRPEESEWVERGRIHTILPYTMQDAYDRNLMERYMDCAVLENAYLRATFLLDMGGRLWSLYSKTENRELLYENPVFQPANLALRNAWFSGGVEWNIGMIGHHPYTCSPMYGAESKNTAGEPVLLMYEYERKRKTPYAVEATLSEDVLLIRVRVENPWDTPAWTYWWSNIAVEEKEGNRVIVPAAQSYTYTREKETNRITVGAEEIPYIGDWDISYPATHRRARDFFFRLPPEQKRFIANVDTAGKGMAQFSTPEQIGRKLFVWGAASQGGKTWNRWLSHSDMRYTEVQAGLLRSQMEQSQMLPHSAYGWIEGYSAYSGEPSVLHGKDYAAAGAYVESGIAEKMERLREEAFCLTEEAVLHHYGSGWGALEEMATGKPLFSKSWMRFPLEAVQAEERDILTLLETGHLPTRDAGDWFVPPYVAGEEYIRLLENGDTDWYTMYLLGCAYYENRQYTDAREAFLASVGDAESALACRALAWLNLSLNEREEARKWMQKALAHMGEYTRLLIDAARFYSICGTDAEICSMIENAPACMRENGRVRMLYANSLVHLHRLEEALAIVNSNLVVPDIQEGELSICQLWLDLYRKWIAREENRQEEEISDAEIYQKYPIPADFDFRMGVYEVH